MIRHANRWLGVMVCAGFAACGSPPTPFAAESKPVAASSGAARAESPEPTAAAEVRPGKVTRIPLGTFFERQQAGTALIYDVRPAFFHGLGHIPGSRNWPKSAYEPQLERREAEIREAVAAGRVVVVYCTDLACPDARSVAERLAQRGHSVAVLEGGWEAWKTGDLPTD